MPTGVFTRLVARPGCEDRLRELYARAIAGMESEPATLAYELHEIEDEPGTFWTYQLYEGPDALEEHLSAVRDPALVAEITALLARPVEVICTNRIVARG